MDWVSLGLQVAGVLAPFAVSAVAWVGKEVALLVRAKTKSEVFGTAIDRLNVMVLTVVTQLEQTMVAEIKARNAKAGGGEGLTSADADAVKQAAIAKLRTYMGSGGLALLATTLKIEEPKVIDLLSDKIESTLYLQKQAPGALPPFYAGDPAGVVSNDLARNRTGVMAGK